MITALNNTTTTETLLHSCQDDRLQCRPVTSDPNNINGVYVPQDVLTQLREAGVIPSQLLSGELQEAIAADADGRVINNPTGTSFVDQLKLSYDEAQNLAAAQNTDNVDTDLGDDDNDDLEDYEGLTPGERREKRSFVKTLIEERNQYKVNLATRDTYERDSIATS